MNKFFLEKAYLPQKVEDSIYQLWQKSGFFNPDKLPGAKKRKPFSIAMPLPNVTGDLHIGHAVTITIEDLICRFRRMQGFGALWIPGTDHAGIATQVMVERELKKEGKTKWNLGKEKFLKRVWQFKDISERKILSQIKKLGASCDWSRYHFTLEPKLNRAVQEAFIRLYQAGLIYRGKRLVNWCPRCQTVLSDLEVEYKEEKGKLWYIKYKIKNQKSSHQNKFGTGQAKIKNIVVATTRPETMLGDTAVAVHPKDKRYKNLIGKIAILPIREKEIPVISDFRVDPEFGTGAVKITPAHDPQDWEIGQEYKLGAPQIIGKDGKMTQEAQEFAGLSIFEAREKIIERLKKEGLLEKTKDYIHSVGHCYRCGKTIESLISKQWFIKIKPLAKKAYDAVKKGKIKIIPKRFEKVYFNWMENIKDWCISRQIWWGHRLPVWFCQTGHLKSKIKNKNLKIEDCFVVSSNKPKKCPKCSAINFIQSEDTLDTWFSSSLWTFSTLGWPASAKATAVRPKKIGDLKRFHPTSCMETGWDILLFWVARMMMMSLYLLKEIPFKTVYLHGLVLDPKTRQKMSKTKGTGIVPQKIILEFGTDALRMSLVLGTTAGQDFFLYPEKIAGFRNFSNKLWNMARFISSQQITINNQQSIDLSKLTLADRWILSRQNGVIAEVTENLENYQFSEAGSTLYDFTWHELADWYLEISKFSHKISQQILFEIFISILKMLHPFMPFITEEIWQRLKLGKTKKELLIIQNWPKVNKNLINQGAEKEFEEIKNLVIKIRNWRQKRKILPSKIVKYKIKKKYLPEEQKIIERLAKVKLK